MGEKYCQTCHSYQDESEMFHVTEETSTGKKFLHVCRYCATELSEGVSSVNLKKTFGLLPKVPEPAHYLSKFPQDAEPLKFIEDFEREKAKHLKLRTETTILNRWKNVFPDFHDFHKKIWIWFDEQMDNHASLLFMFLIGIAAGYAWAFYHFHN